MSRGNGGQAIIADPNDLDGLRAVIAKVKRTADFHLYSYCLMNNHVHFLIQVGTVPISRVMQRILATWSIRFNLKYHRSGHVFQGRFKSLPCDNDAYFRWLLRYININPVKAGLVKHPEDWVWSSYAEFMDPTEG
ncbi:MAG: transposase, partial [Elusimicrobiota bacterium]